LKEVKLTEEIKKWGGYKKFLLRSGVPLEANVSKICQKEGMMDLGEFFYKREEDIFSVDLLARDVHRKKANDLEFGTFIDFLIECKYREPHKKWIFSSFEFGEKHLTGREMWLSNDFSISYPFDDIEVSNLIASIPRYIYEKINFDSCNKGVEVSDKGFDPNSINHALFQVLFAVPYQGISEISAILEYGTSDDVVGEIIVPVIVTTSDLYLLDKSTDLEKIRESKNGEEILKRKEIIQYEIQPPLHLTEYSNSLISKYENNLPNQYLEDWSAMSIQSPSRVYIINYNYFPKYIKIIKILYGSIAKRSMEEYFKQR